MAALRVLVISPEAGSYGGTVRFLERLLEIHAANSIVTALLLPTGTCSLYLEASAQRLNVEIIREPDRNSITTPPLITPFYDALFSYSTVQYWKPDLVVVSTGDPGRMSIALYYPVPVLYVLHTTPDQKLRFLPRMYLMAGSTLGNLLMTVSEHSAECIARNMGIRRKRIAVVHNSCRPAAVRGLPERTLVLTVGHLAAYKNPYVWLQTAQQVIMLNREVTFVWLGDGELLADMRERVKALDLESRVKLPGYVADPSAWYARATLYFQPSIRESHGIAVLEAMSNGLPCVVADSGGLPESVVAGSTGFVTPVGDTGAYSAGIIKLLEDPDLNIRMGEAGRLRVTEHFSESVQEQKILSLYARLLRRNLMDT